MVSFCYNNTMIIFGIIGLLLISYGLWVKNEKYQDIIYIVGGLSLLIYSIEVGNTIFIILQIVFVLSAIVELIKITKK